MSKVQEAVNSLLKKMSDRSDKISKKVEMLQEEAVSTKDSIDRLMRELVNAELEEDAQGQADMNKRIANLRSEYEGLNAKIQAYQSTLGDEFGLVKDALPQIITVAKKEIGERLKVIGKKQAEKDKLQRDLDNAQKGIERLDIELENLSRPMESHAMAPLVKYIAPRVEYRDRLGYMQSFLHDETGEALKRHLERLDSDEQDVSTKGSTIIDLSPREIPEPSSSVPRNQTKTETAYLGYR